MKLAHLVLALCSLAIVASTPAFATDCTVAVPKSEFVYEGYPIYFDFSKLLTSHGYQVVSETASPRFILEIQGQMNSGRWFRSAETRYVMREFGIEKPALQITKTKTCVFTDLCAVTDFQKSFVRGFRDLEKTLPFCR